MEEGESGHPSPARMVRVSGRDRVGLTSTASPRPLTVWREHKHCHYRFVCSNSNLVCSPNVNTFLSSRWSSPTSDNSPESVEVFPSRDPQHHVLKHLLAIRVVFVEARTFSDSSGDYFDEEDSIDNFKQGTLDMPNVQSCDSA